MTALAIILYFKTYPGGATMTDTFYEVILVTAALYMYKLVLDEMKRAVVETYGAITVNSI
jgi:hypothetical protein